MSKTREEGNGGLSAEIVVTEGIVGRLRAAPASPSRTLQHASNRNSGQEPSCRAPDKRTVNRTRCGNVSSAKRDYLVVNYNFRSFLPCSVMLGVSDGCGFF